MPLQCFTGPRLQSQSCVRSAVRPKMATAFSFDVHHNHTVHESSGRYSGIELSLSSSERVVGTMRDLCDVILSSRRFAESSASELRSGLPAATGIQGCATALHDEDVPLRVLPVCHAGKTLCLTLLSSAISTTSSIKSVKDGLMEA